MTTCTLKQALVAVKASNQMCGIESRNRASALIITNAVFGGLALLALAVRMLVSLQAHIYGWDDLCAVVAFLFAAPITFGQIYAGTLGFGKDTWAVPPENIYVIMKVRTFRVHHMEYTLTRNTDCVFQPAVVLHQCRC